MDRRSFLGSAGAAAVAFAFPHKRPVVSIQKAEATADGWRTFEITTRVEILKPPGKCRVWLPAALTAETAYQKSIGTDFEAGAGVGKFVEATQDGLAILSVEFPEGATPAVTATSHVATQDVAVDLTKTGKRPKEPREALEHFLRPTKLLPTDGIVKTKAVEITAGKDSDIEKARAIYEWIVENTFRNPKTKGCGLGDIRYMLESKDLGGKCADLNALFVGLARAAGLPARDVYGIRLAKSDLGYKSLGPSTATITKAQHCRAEVYLEDYGWVPVDPADVRKVALEEPPGNLPMDHDMVKKARARLFGSWEMNWMAYNYAHDVALPGSKLGPVGFFMYPQAETEAGRLDCLDPDSFRYEITARETTFAAAQERRQETSV